MSRMFFLWMILWTMSLGRSAAIGQAPESGFRLAVFSADVTIPLGHRCMGILPTKSKSSRTHWRPGALCFWAGETAGALALDWCEVRNGAYDQWRDALAKAAGTTRERVLVSCLHQHDAPVRTREPKICWTKWD